MATGPSPNRPSLEENFIDQPLNMSTKKSTIIKPPNENSHLREILESKGKTSEPFKPMPILPKASRFPAGPGLLPESFPAIRETHSVPVFQSSISVPIYQSSGSSGSGSGSGSSQYIESRHSVSVYQSSSSSGSSQYPSSPGSSHSSSTNISLDSPPRTQTPPTMVPVFALHPSGLYYVASLVHFHSLEIQAADDYSSVCHPVTIPVQFCANRMSAGNSQLQTPKTSPELPIPCSVTGIPQQPWIPTPSSAFYPSPPHVPSLINRASVLAAALEKPIHS